MKKAFIFSVLFCVFFSLQLVLQQLFLRNSITPLHLTFLTNLFAFILITAYLLFFNRKFFKIKFTKKSFWIFTAATLTWMIADISSMFGLKYSSSINMSLISRLQVIITYVLAVIFFKETLTKNKTVAAILAFVGGLFVVYDFKSAVAINPGDLLFLLFSISITVSSLFRQKIYKHLPAIQLTYFMYGISALFFGAVTIIFFPLKTVPVPGFILSNSIIALLGFICVNTAIGLGGATFFSVVSSILPLFTAILAFFILGNAPLMTQVVGAVIITYSIYLFTKKS